MQEYNVSLEKLNSSIIVNAKGHNPSILHPSFLVSEKIIPTDWETAEPPICTPEYSSVRFKNELSIVVEGNKCQFLDGRLYQLSDSLLPDLALNYCLKLPHVPYSAVGLNFLGILSQEDAEQFIIHRFLKESNYNTSPAALSALGLKFVYTLPQYKLSVTIDSGEVTNKKDGTKKIGLLSSFNYHTNLKNGQTIDQLKSAIGLYAKHAQEFVDLSLTIFGVGK